MDTKAIQTVEAELMDELQSSMFCIICSTSSTATNTAIVRKAIKKPSLQYTAWNGEEVSISTILLMLVWRLLYSMLSRWKFSKIAIYHQRGIWFRSKPLNHIGITWLTLFPGPSRSLGIIHLRSRGSYRSVCNTKKRWRPHLDKLSLYFSARSLRTTTSIWETRWIVWLKLTVYCH